MSFNVKKKVMLAVLAGGMLCANGALAFAVNQWYGDASNVSGWKGTTASITDGCTTGANLTLIGTEGPFGGIAFGDVKVFFAGYSDTVSVTSNFLTINDGNFGTDAEICGGYSSGGNAAQNNITINGGTFVNNNTICGGFSGSGASGNIVTISGGTFGRDTEIYGGYTGSGGAASDNTVNIDGGTFDDGFYLYGGFVYPGTSSNNTLNLKVKVGGKAVIVGCFQTMNFTLPSNITNGDVMLKTEGLMIVQSGGTATINVYAANGVTLKEGDVITLIESDATYDTFIGGDVLGGAGEVSMTDGSDGDPRNIILTLLKDFEQKAAAGGGDKEKAPVEGIAAGVAMINQSADLASGEGMQNLLKNTGNFDKTETNYNIDTFGAVTGSRTKYKTGSHVDMDGWGFLVGVGTTKEWTHAGKTTYGIFFEYGKGDFDTYNNDIHGEGESVNRGAGLMARQTLNNNTYYEGNIRYGKLKTDWSETEIGGYNTDSKYYGITMGIGHIYPVNNGWNEIDIYGRYTYGHVGGSDATVGENQYKFDSVNSSRLRVGTKLNIIVKGKKVKPYVGVAWEREMKGESKATITGMGEAPAPSLKGNTGIMQAGCSWEAGKWTLGAEANAYIGKRKGWGGMFNAFYNF